MAEDFDPWELTTGLSEVVQGEVTEAFFTFDNSYNNGDTCLLKLVVDDKELGEQTLLFPCGDGWEPKKGGKEVAHSSGSTKNFNNQSGVGLLISSAMDNGIGDTLRATGKTPFQADLWTGLDLVFTRTEFTFKTSGGEERSYHRMLPTAINDTTKPKAKKAKKAKAEKVEEEVEEVEETEEAEEFDVKSIPAKTRGQMKAVAMSADDNDDFIEKLYTSDFEIADELETHVFNGVLYKALRA